MKLKLADGKDFEYAEARIVIENGGVLRVVQGGQTTFYAANQWVHVDYAG
ncbi:hypothetical protein SEA_CRATER_35 [Gordonia phage Crater]|nr:hypothetical protein SEA_CRATER_35 [Gordonia phage Crater]